MSIFEQLGNMGTPPVTDALTRKCRICDAEPGALCTNVTANLTNGYPLHGRLVHYDRTAP